MNRDFKGVFIPREVWLSDRLSLIQKAFIAEIDSLDSGKRRCFATNKYFADFFRLSIKRVSEIINELVRAGIVSSYIDKENNNARTLFINRKGLATYTESTKSINKNTDRVSRKTSIRYPEEYGEGIPKNQEYITKDYNKVDNSVVDVVNIKASQKNENSISSYPKTLTELELGGAAESVKIKAEIATLKANWAGFEKEKERWIKDNANVTEFESELHAANTFKKRMIELAKLSKQVGGNQKQTQQQQQSKPLFGNPNAKPQYNGAKYYPPGCEQIFKQREEREKKAKEEALANQQAQKS